MLPKLGKSLVAAVLNPRQPMTCDVDGVTYNNSDVIIVMKSTVFSSQP